MALQRPARALSNRPPPAPPIPQKPSPVRNMAFNHGAFHDCVMVVPEEVALPPVPTHRDFALYAIIGTYFEGDVIEATVKNCLANGCEKVFVIDNDSPDDTRVKAWQAGATVYCNYKTEYYDDDFRVRLMNRVMEKITIDERHKELWWLALDADEFPCGPGGTRIVDYLSKLDPRYNCVGIDTIDLYPTTLPHYVSGQHPADHMPSGVRRHGPFCKQRHWKHPLLRNSNGQYRLMQSRGLHIPFALCCEGMPFTAAIEPPEPMPMFHAAMRAKEFTSRRLKAMCETKPGNHSRGALDDKVTQSNGSIKRWQSMEDVYAGRWDQVKMAHSQMYGDITGIALIPWRRLLPKVSAFPRWYGDDKKIADQKQAKIELPLV